MKMESHFVTFYSPGTFVAENTTVPIPSWDIKLAEKMAKDITERHNAHPYCFQFTTRGRDDNELDSKVTKISCRYFIEGKVETLAEVERTQPGSILASNMRCNHIKRVISTTKGWKWTIPLKDDDYILHPAVTR